MAKKKKRKKKLAVRHRNKKGRFSKRGKRERVYTQAVTIFRRIAKRERVQQKAQAKEFRKASAALRKAEREQARAAKQKAPETPSVETYVWVISFSYDDSDRSFDIDVTAEDETQAYSTALEFLRGDREGKKLLRSGQMKRGWTPTIAKGEKTSEEAGLAEYRNESQA
jgi:hypothetical protein